MSDVSKLVIAVLVLGLAFTVTLPKLYRMGQIRGFVPGALVSTETVHALWRETPKEHPGSPTYWVTWSDSDI